MKPIRLLRSCGEGHGASLAQHLRRLQDAGPVVFITADRPLAGWLPLWREAGLDLDQVFVLDAVSAMNGQQPSPRPGNAMFLPSPVMLEMLLLRAEQTVARRRPVRVVVDSLTTLALYNGTPAVVAFCHYLANRLRALDVPADLVLCDGPESAALRDRLAPLLDEHVELEAVA